MFLKLKKVKHKCQRANVGKLPNTHFKLMVKVHTMVTSNFIVI